MVNGSPAAFAPPNRLTRRNNPPHIPAPSHCPAAIALYNCSLLFSWSSLLCSVGRQYHLLTLIISYATRKIYQKCKNFLQTKRQLRFCFSQLPVSFLSLYVYFTQPGYATMGRIITSAMLACWPVAICTPVSSSSSHCHVSSMPGCSSGTSGTLLNARSSRRIGKL